MRIAWCPEHRGVMRIAFFNPPPAHFSNPCPRCQKPLQQEERSKYEPEIGITVEDVAERFPDEIPIKAPRPVCPCCCFFGADFANYEGYCSWCVDCPTEMCDIPRKYLKREKQEKRL